MNEEAAFLRAICENPDDDTPRLVFADWLTEQGETGAGLWAELIRAQIGIAAGHPDAILVGPSQSRDTFGGRLHALNTFGLAHAQVSAWDRGFPSVVGGAYDTLRGAWPRYANRLPVRGLSISGLSEANVAEFLMWPRLSLLRELRLSGGYAGRSFCDAVPLLAQCEALRGLQTLTLDHIVITDGAAMALLESPYLAGLTRLKWETWFVEAPLSPAVEDWLFSRFGPGVLGRDIPF